MAHDNVSRRQPVSVIELLHRSADAVEPNTELPELAVMVDSCPPKCPINEALRRCNGNDRITLAVQLFCLWIEVFYAYRQTRYDEAITVFGAGKKRISTQVFVTLTDYGREVKLWNIEPNLVSARSVTDSRENAIVTVHALTHNAKALANILEHWRACYHELTGRQLILCASNANGVSIYSDDQS